MEPKTPIQLLIYDHRIIAKVIGAAPVLADRLEGGADVDIDTILGVIEFMRTFGDRCHHGKEEEMLFPSMIEKGFPAQGGPIAVLIMEHIRGREIVKSMADAVEGFRNGDQNAKQVIIRELHAIAKLYSGHIAKEEQVFFPMCEQVLNKDEQQSLSVQFEEVEKRIGHDVHQQLEEFAERLSKMTANG